MANTEKVFVDLNEDIVFILERVRQSLAPKVVLVVPKSSNITSSLVSLKLLTRQISKINKLVVLSTDDEYGIDQAKKADLVAVGDTGEITPDVWMEAKKQKDEYIERLERKKRELLSKRQEKEAENKEYKVIEEKSEVEEAIQDEKEEKDLEEQINVYQKQRIPPRLLSVGPIKFYAAGDVRQDREAMKELLPLELKEVSEKEIKAVETSEISEPKKKDSFSRLEDKSFPRKNEPHILKDEDIIESGSDSNDHDETQDKEGSRYKSRGTLAGKNLAHAQSSPLKRPQKSFSTEKPKSRASSGLSNSKSSELLDKAKNFINNKKNRKFIFAGLSIVLFLSLFSMVSGSSASITVTVKKDDISITEEISADPSVEGISFSEFKIPATNRNTTDDVSESINTTGEGSTGEKAKGQVDIYNKTTNTIALKAGSKIKIEGSGLEYNILSDVSIPANDPGVAKDVQIEAASHGENYNADSGKDFSVGSYTLEQVKAVSFSPIIGGTSRDTRTISQDDYDSAKEILTKRLESTASITLEELAGADEIFFSETITVEITEETSSAEVGSEADKFDLSITAEMSGLFVKKSDIEAIAKEIAQSRQAIEGDSEINISQFPQIEDITFADGVATFKIFTDASAKANITKEVIAENVEGKSLGVVEEYLEGEPDILSYKLNYSPWYMPGFLKKMPSADNIEIRVVSR